MLVEMADMVFIKIVHQSPYKTSYSHLSKNFSEKRAKSQAGSNYRKGRFNRSINRTAPSLSSMENNKFVDAMKEKMPRTQKLSSSEMKKFEKEKRIKHLEELRQTTVVEQSVE